MGIHRRFDALCFHAVLFAHVHTYRTLSCICACARVGSHLFLILSLLNLRHWNRFTQCKLTFLIHAVDSWVNLGSTDLCSMWIMGGLLTTWKNSGLVTVRLFCFRLRVFSTVCCFILLFPYTVCQREVLLSQFLVTDSYLASWFTHKLLYILRDETIQMCIK